MIEVQLLTLIGTGIPLLFTVAFLYTWRRWNKLHYCLWLSAAFFLFAATVLSQLLDLSQRAGLGALTSSLFCIAATLTLIHGCSMRLRYRPYRVLNAAISAVIAASAFYFYGVDRNLPARVCILRLGLGMLLLIAAVQAGRAARKTIDHISFWILLLFSMHLFSYALLTITHANRPSSISTFQHSSVWIWLNVSSIIFIALLGCTLLLTAASDIFEKLKADANTDELTGLLNRRGFKELANQRVACEKNAPASLIVCDLDHFKTINDTYGHPAGDTVLAMVAKLLLANIRESDVAGRIGGEEFALLLCGLDRNQAYALAERLREAIAKARFGDDELQRHELTASFGIVECDRRESLESAIQHADKMLYQAKYNGRNRTYVHQEEPQTDSILNVKTASEIRTESIVRAQ